MVKVVYQVVEHDGGWAYRVDGVYSETYRSRDAAHGAAEHAAREQKLAGEDSMISFEDEKGRWHDERAEGADRPETEIQD